MTGIYDSPNKFAQEKKRILSKGDFSKKGSIDKGIKDIVDRINSKSDYCTTSSCAGRITLLEKRTNRKDHSNWLFSSHTTVKAKDLAEKMNSEHDVWLIQESFIIHVFCRNLEAASKLLSVCRDIGLKHSGIVSISKKLMVEAIGNEKIETLMMRKGKVLVDADYLDVMTAECNNRMEANMKKLAILYSKLNLL